MAGEAYGVLSGSIESHRLHARRNLAGLTHSGRRWRSCTGRLQSNLVIPLFLNGAKMPPIGWLKNCGLERLHTKQGEPLRATADYDHDLARIVALLRGHCPELPAKPVVVAPLTPPPVTPLPRTVWQPAVLYPLQPAPHLILTPLPPAFSYAGQTFNYYIRVAE